LKLYDTSKKGIRLRNSRKTVNKPYFIFVVKLCKELYELAKTNTKLKEQLDSINWNKFISDKLTEEFEKVKPVTQPKKGEIKDAEELEEESTSYSELLFEKLTSYNYAELVDCPIEDIEVPLPPEEPK